MLTYLQFLRGNHVQGEFFGFLKMVEEKGAVSAENEKKKIKEGAKKGEGETELTEPINSGR